MEFWSRRLESEDRASIAGQLGILFFFGRGYGTRTQITGTTGVGLVSSSVCGFSNFTARTERPLLFVAQAQVLDSPVKASCWLCLEVSRHTCVIPRHNRNEYFGWIAKYVWLRGVAKEKQCVLIYDRAQLCTTVEKRFREKTIVVRRVRPLLLTLRKPFTLRGSLCTTRCTTSSWTNIEE